MERIKIVAADMDSSKFFGEIFSFETMDDLKKSIEDFETKIPYRKYELICEDSIDDFPYKFREGIVNILEEKEITYMF